MDKCRETLQVDREVIVKAFGTIALEDMIVIEDLNRNILEFREDNKAVYLAKFHFSETSIATKLKTLINAPKSIRTIDSKKAIEWVQQQLDITSVYVTHDQIEAMTLSDRIVVMNEGLIEQIGTPEELYRHPRTRFVAGFIGRANFVRGTVQEVSADKTELVVQALQGSVTVPGVQDAHRVGEEVTLIIRPEMIRVVDDARVKGTVKRASYLGDAIDYDFEGYSLKEAQRQLEKRLITKALIATGGNRTKATRLLESSHPSLLSKIKAYNIEE